MCANARTNILARHQIRIACLDFALATRSEPHYLSSIYLSIYACTSTTSTNKWDGVLLMSLLWVAAYGILVSFFFAHRLIWAYTYIVEEGTFFYLVRSRLYWLLLCTTTNVSIDNRSIMTNNWWLTCNVPTMSAKSAGERTKTILNRCADGAIFWGKLFVQF